MPLKKVSKKSSKKQEHLFWVLFGAGNIGLSPQITPKTTEKVRKDVLLSKITQKSEFREY